MRIRLGLWMVLFVAGMLSSHSARAGEVICPRSFADPVTKQALALDDAALWAGVYQIGIEDAQERRDFGLHMWGRWQLKGFERPRFIVCRYGVDRHWKSQPQVVLPVPEEAKTCEMEIRRQKKGSSNWDILKFVCSGVPAEKWQASAADKPSRATELGGISLAMTRAQIETHVQASGGTVTADGQRLAIQVKGESLLVFFAPDAERPSRIVALLPPRMNDREGNFLSRVDEKTYLSLVRRYGTVYNSDQIPNPHWEGRDDVWLVYKPGRRPTQDRQEIHLIDGRPDATDSVN